MKFFAERSLSCWGRRTGEAIGVDTLDGSSRPARAVAAANAAQHHGPRPTRSVVQGVVVVQAARLATVAG